ncbi:MAG: hypothetical protein KTR24_00645 [Saprospiraceae bacterium]|nr:hypothetical protein [Saprospiraceae bacterium]
MSIFTDLLDTLFPSLCPGCQANLLPGDNYFCVACSYASPCTDYHRLPQNNALDRIAGRTQFAHGASLFRMYPEGRVHALMHEIKYRGRWKLAEKLGRAMGSLMVEEGHLFPQDPIIVPVPLHRSRVRSRGYNQSHHLASGLAQSTGWRHCPNFLKRIVDTPSQTKLSRLNRLQNLNGAFEVVDGILPPNMDLLLLDDILTTGATMEACYRTLMSSEPRTISFLTVGLAFS